MVTNETGKQQTPTSVTVGLVAAHSYTDLIPLAMWACNFHVRYQRDSAYNTSDTVFAECSQPLLITPQEGQLIIRCWEQIKTKSSNFSVNLLYLLDDTHFPANHYSRMPVNYTIMGAFENENLTLLCQSLLPIGWYLFREGQLFCFVS